MVVRLSFTAEPVWLDLLGGVRVEVQPYGSAITARMRAILRRKAVEHAQAVKDGKRAARPELDEVTALFAESVAVAAITAWEGVIDDDTGEPLPVTDDTVRALMSFPPIMDAFQRLYLEPGLAMVAEKNASSPSPNGTSAEAMVIAVPAGLRARTASIQ